MPASRTSLLLLVVLLGLVAACGGDDDDGGGDVAVDETEETTSDGDAEAYLPAVEAVCSAYVDARPEITAETDFDAAADAQLDAVTEAHDGLSAIEPDAEQADLHDGLLAHFDPESPELVAVVDAIRSGDTDAILEASTAWELDDETATAATEAGLLCV